MADLKISVDIDASGTKKGAAEAKAAIKSISDEAQKTGRSVKSVAEQDFGALDKQAAKAAESVAGTSSSLGGLAAIGGPVTAIIAAIGAALLVVVGVALTLAREITHLVAQFAEYARTIKIASDETGIAVTTMSALKYGVEAAGGKFDDITGSLKTFSKTIADANEGSKTAAAKLTRLGIDGTKAANDLEGAFRQALVKIASLPEGVQRAAAANDAFGDSGARLLPFIKQFGGNIDEVVKKAKDLGLVLSTDDVEAAAAFEKSLSEIKLQVEAVALAFGKNFLPAVKATLDSVNQYLADNQAAIKNWADNQKTYLDGVAGYWRSASNAVSDYNAWLKQMEVEHPWLFARTPDYAQGIGTGLSKEVLDRLKQAGITARGNQGTLGSQEDEYALYNAGRLPLVQAPYTAPGPGKLPKVPKIPKAAKTELSDEAKQAQEFAKRIKDAQIELAYFGDKSEEAAVKQQLLKEGIFDVNKELAGALIAYGKDKDAKIASAAADKLKADAAKRLADTLDGIKNAGIGTRDDLQGQLAAVNQQIALGRELNDVEQLNIDNKAALLQLQHQLEASGFNDTEITQALDELRTQQSKNRELATELQRRKDIRTALELNRDLNSQLDSEIQDLNVQLGLSAELSRADAVAKQLQGDAYKSLTQETKDATIAKAAEADSLRELAKEQEAAKRKYEEVFGTIRDSLQVLADQGFGAFFKSVLRKFQSFLLDLVAQWLTSKFFSLFYKGGNSQIAQQNGQGGGGIIGNILQGILGQGAGQQQGSGQGGIFNSPYILNASGGGNGGLVLNTGNLPGAPGSPSNPGGGGGLGGLLGGITIAGGLATVLGGAIGGRTGGFISNIGSGAALGAQIGSIIPGIGTLIGAGIGAAVGFFASLFGGNPAEKRDKKEKLPALTAGFTDALQQLRQLIEDVRTLRVSPESALAKATELRGQIAGGFGIQFESKKYQRESQRQIAQKLAEADALIAQLRDVADVARAAGERDRRLLPEFAGGVYLSPAFQSFRRQNGMLGGVYTGRDTIPSMLSPGEMVLNPSQMSRVRGAAGFDVFKTAGIPGYASGGVVQPATVQNGPVNLTINLSQDAEGMWTATAESDAGQRVIAKVVSNAFANDAIKTKRR